MSLFIHSELSLSRGLNILPFNHTSLVTIQTIPRQTQQYFVKETL